MVVRVIIIIVILMIEIILIVIILIVIILIMVTMVINYHPHILTLIMSWFEFKDSDVGSDKRKEFD